MNSHPYAKTIWNKLMAEINNEYGVAGLMGNLRAESGLYPDRVQGDIPYSSYSKEYTAKVDSGVISEYDFVHNGPNGKGYGLAQWTFYTRKQELYDWYKTKGYSSIGSVDLACDFLLYELKGYGLLSVLKNATSIREVSDIILHDFENPADQSESVEIVRYNLGVEVYNAFSGSEPVDPDPDDPDVPITPIKRKKLSKLLLMAIATDSD